MNMKSASFIPPSSCRAIFSRVRSDGFADSLFKEHTSVAFGNCHKRSRQLRFACGKNDSSSPILESLTDACSAHSWQASAVGRDQLDGGRLNDYGLGRHSTKSRNQSAANLQSKLQPDESSSASSTSAYPATNEAASTSPGLQSQSAGLSVSQTAYDDAEMKLSMVEGAAGTEVGQKVVKSLEDQSKLIVPENHGQTLFLVDAFGLLFRSYYALAKTTMSSRGLFDTRAVYGFTVVMLSFLNKHAKGNPVVVVFEGKKETGQLDFRSAVYPEYKKDRGPTPTGVVEAVPWVKKMCRVMGLRLAEVDVYEADDTIGSIVYQAKQAGVPSVIVSMDKDFRQLLDGEMVRILRPGSGGSFEYVTEDSFRNEFGGVHPRQYVDILTLIGDNVDGLRGVPGIGKLTAPKLIAHYGSLESLLTAADCYLKNDANRQSSKEEFPFLTKRIASNLHENAKHAQLVKQLITIKENVPLAGLSWEILQRKRIDEQEVKALSGALEFTNRNIVGKIIRSADDVAHFGEDGLQKDHESLPTMPTERTFKSSSRTHSDVNAHQSEARSLLNSSRREFLFNPSGEDAEEVLKEARHVIGLMGMMSASGHLTAVSIIVPKGRGLFFDLTEKRALPLVVKQVLEDKHVEKRGWFLKSLYKEMKAKWQIHLAGTFFDVRIAAEMLHAGERITDTRLASMYLGSGSLDRWIQGADHRIRWPEKREDCIALCELGLRLSERLIPSIVEAELSYVLYSVEFPLIPVLGDMELAGVPFDSNGLHSLEERVRIQKDAIESKLKEVVPVFEELPEFRPSSRDDVCKLLFDIWKVPIQTKKTPKGRFSVNRSVLLSLSQDEKATEQHKLFAKLMLEHRETSKILSTYTRSLIAAVHPDGRIRTTFVQEAAATGRLSTSRPNMQSIPVRSELGKEVRRMVSAPKGFSILCADYSQIELRIIAALSGDESLREGFKEGADIHRAVAAKVFKVSSPGEVSDEQRRKAKEVNYGIPYGISSHGLGQHLNISSKEAMTLMSQFHTQFPGVKLFTQDLITNAKDTGFARTMLGRRLALPLIIHGGPSERKAAERIAINMPIQGTQADMIKLAMIRIAERLANAKAKSRLIMQIHDELLVEVENSELRAVKALVEEEMISALPLSGVDVVVNTGVGDSWLQAAQK